MKSEGGKVRVTGVGQETPLRRQFDPDVVVFVLRKGRLLLVTNCYLLLTLAERW